MVRTQRVTCGHWAGCPGHTKHSVLQDLHQLLPLCSCSLSAPPHPEPVAADTPAPPAAPESVRPPPAWPCLWSQSPAVGFTPVALALGQSTTHPQPGGHCPSGQCSQAARPSSRVCSSALCPCPTPGALPAPHHPLPQRLCSSALDTVQAGRSSRSRAQGLAQHANKVHAVTQDVPFLATELTEEEVGIELGGQSSRKR